jgi:hypothetical protein
VPVTPSKTRAASRKCNRDANGPCHLDIENIGSGDHLRKIYMNIGLYGRCLGLEAETEASLALAISGQLADIYVSSMLKP